MVFFHSCQAEVESLKAEGKTGVINSHEFKNGGLKIMNVNGVLDHVKTQLIGLAQSYAWFRSSARHPHGEGLGVMISPIATSQRCAGLDHRGSSKFTAPNDQGVLQHPKSLEILHESGAGLIDGFGLIALASVFPIIAVLGYAQLTAWLTRKRAAGESEERT